MGRLLYQCSCEHANRFQARAQAALARKSTGRATHTRPIMLSWSVPHTTNSSDATRPGPHGRVASGLSQAALQSHSVSFPARELPVELVGHCGAALKHGFLVVTRLFDLAAP